MNSKDAGLPSWQWAVVTGAIAGLVVFPALTYHRAFDYFVSVDPFPVWALPLMWGYAGVGHFFDPTFALWNQTGPVVAFLSVIALLFALPLLRKGVRSFVGAVLTTLYLGILTFWAFLLGIYYTGASFHYPFGLNPTAYGGYFWKFAVLFVPVFMGLCVPYLAVKVLRKPPGVRLKALIWNAVALAVFAFLLEIISLFLGVGYSVAQEHGFDRLEHGTDFVSWAVVSIGVGVAAVLLLRAYFVAATAARARDMLLAYARSGGGALLVMFVAMVGAYWPPPVSPEGFPREPRVPIVQWLLSSQGLFVVSYDDFVPGYTDWLIREVGDKELRSYRYPGSFNRATRDFYRYGDFLRWFAEGRGSKNALAALYVRHTAAADPSLSTIEAERLTSALFAVVPANLWATCYFLEVAYRQLPETSRKKYRQVWEKRVKRARSLQRKLETRQSGIKCFAGDAYFNRLKGDAFPQERRGEIRGKVHLRGLAVDEKDLTGVFAVAASTPVTEISHRPSLQGDAGNDRVWYERRIRHFATDREGAFSISGLPFRSYRLLLAARADAFPNPQGVAILSLPGDIVLTEERPSANVEVVLGPSIPVEVYRVAGETEAEIRWEAVPGAHHYRFRWWSGNQFASCGVGPARATPAVMDHPARCWSRYGAWNASDKEWVISRKTTVRIPFPAEQKVLFPWLVAVDARGRIIATNLTLFPPRLIERG